MRLRLTEAGRKLVPVLAKEADENDEAFFGVVGEAELQHLLEMVKLLLTKHGW